MGYQTEGTESYWEAYRQHQTTSDSITNKVAEGKYRTE
jgi:hypothetical protein